MLTRSARSKIPSAPVAEEYNVIATPRRHQRLQSIMFTTIQAFSCDSCSRPVDVRLCSTPLALGPRKSSLAVHRCRILPPDRLMRSTSHLNLLVWGAALPFSAFVFIMPLFCILRIRSWASSFFKFDLPPLTVLSVFSSAARSSTRPLFLHYPHKGAAIDSMAISLTSIYTFETFGGVGGRDAL